MIGELSTRSDEYRSRWADLNILAHQAGVARISHPVIGTVDLFWEAMNLVGDIGLTLIAHDAEPGSESAEHCGGMTLKSRSSAPLKNRDLSWRRCFAF